MKDSRYEVYYFNARGEAVEYIHGKGFKVNERDWCVPCGYILTTRDELMNYRRHYGFKWSYNISEKLDNKSHGSLFAIAGRSYEIFTIRGNEIEEVNPIVDEKTIEAYMNILPTMKKLNHPPRL